MLRARVPAPVRRLVLVHEQEGPLGVAGVGEPVERPVGDDVGGVAPVPDAVGGAEQPGVVVGALVPEHLVMVEPFGAGLQVPLPEQCRLVARRLQQLRKRLLGAVKRLAVRHHAGEVPVLAGEDGGAAGRADRVGDEGVAEQHALGGQPVDVRRLVDARAVGADGVGRVVVGEDQQDIGAVALARAGGERSHGEGY